MAKKIMKAVKDNKVDEVERLLTRRSASPNECDGDESPALVTACYRGYDSIVQLLLDKGADVNKTKPNGTTALMKAASGGYVSLIDKLIEAGAKCNEKDRTGKTALHHAATNNHSKVVTILLENGCDVNITDNFGDTALKEAEKKNSIDAANAIKTFTVKKPSPSSWPVSFSIVLLVSLLSLGTAVIAVVVPGIIYPTDHSIDTSLPAPTRIREEEAVPLATVSEDDQVTSVKLGKIAEKLGSHYHKIAIHLGFDGEEITQYEDEYKKPYRILFAILDKWQKREHATRKALLDACKKAGVVEAAYKILNES